MRYVVVFVGMALLLTATHLNILSVNMSVFLAYVFGLVIGTWL